MMQRSCDSCGVEYQAKRKASRYCSDTCRKRAQRSPDRSPRRSVEPRDGGVPRLVTATRAELEDAGRLDTVLGQQAMALAERIASPHETGAAVASLSKELRAVMEAALDGVATKADPLDELRARRERKRAAG